MVLAALEACGARREGGLCSEMCCWCGKLLFCAGLLKAFSALEFFYGAFQPKTPSFKL